MNAECELDSEAENAENLDDVNLYVLAVAI